MPELPEVETIRRDLDKDVGGRKVRDVDAPGPMALFDGFSTRKSVGAKLVGRKVLGVARRGLILILDIGDDEVMTLNLGTGARIRRNANKDAIEPDTVLVIGFTALIVVLLRVHDTLRDLRQDVVQLRAETGPLLEEMRTTTDEARNTVDEARTDLERFDKVLGSAEAIGDAVGQGRGEALALLRVHPLPGYPHGAVVTAAGQDLGGGLLSRGEGPGHHPGQGRQLILQRGGGVALAAGGSEPQRGGHQGGQG